MNDSSKSEGPPSWRGQAQRSLVLLLDGPRVLLARKKRGFGRGRIVGIGGAAEAGETLLQAAVREMLEETGVLLRGAQQVAVLDFLFPEVRAHWDMRAAVFVATRWQGVPVETDEVAPLWFHRQEIPYAEMWDDARYWLPEVLAGRRFHARFRFGADLRVTEARLDEAAGREAGQGPSPA